MKKSTKLASLVALGVAVAGIPFAASAKSMTPSEVQDLTKDTDNSTRDAYVFGKHLYVGSITTAQIVEASGTLEGEKNPTLYYVNARGSWSNAVTNAEVDVTTKDFNITKAANLATTVVSTELNTTGSGATKENETTLSFEDDATADIAISKITTISTKGITLGETKLVDTDKLVYNVGSVDVSFNGKKLAITENSPLLEFTAASKMAGATGKGNWIGLLLTLNKQINTTYVKIKVGGTEITKDTANAAEFGGGVRDILVWVKGSDLGTNASPVVLSVEEYNPTKASEKLSDDSYTSTYTSMAALASYTTTTKNEIKVVTENVAVAQAKVDEVYYNIFYRTTTEGSAPSTIDFREAGNLKQIAKDGTEASDLIEFDTKDISKTAYATGLSYMKANSEWNQDAITSVTAVKNDSKKETETSKPDYFVTVTYDKNFKDTESGKAKLFVNLNLSVTTSTTGLTFTSNDVYDIKVNNTDYLAVGIDAKDLNPADTDNEYPYADVSFTKAGKTVLIRFYLVSNVPTLSVATAKSGLEVSLNEEDTKLTTAELNKIVNTNTYYKLLMKSFDSVTGAVQDKNNDGELLNSYTVTLQSNTSTKNITDYVVNTDKGVDTGSGKWAAVLLTFNSNSAAVKASSLNVVAKSGSNNIRFMLQPAIESSDSDALKEAKTYNANFIGNVGGNANSLLVWVDTKTATTQTIIVTNNETQQTTEVNFVVNNVYTGIVPKVDSTPLSVPVIADEYKDVVSYDADAHDFTVNIGTWQFDVTATVNGESGLYTVYAADPSKSDVDAQKWTYVKTLKFKEVLADTNKAYTIDSDDDYNAQSIADVKYTAKTNTIDVTFNKKLVNSGAYNLVVNLGETYAKDTILMATTGKDTASNYDETAYTFLATADEIDALDNSDKATNGAYHLADAFVLNDDKDAYILRADYDAWIKSTVTDAKDNYILVPLTAGAEDGDETEIYFSVAGDDTAKVVFTVKVVTHYVADNGIDMKLTSAAKVNPTLDESYYLEKKIAGMNDATLLAEAQKYGVLASTAETSDLDKDDTSANYTAGLTAAKETEVVLNDAKGLTVDSNITETELSNVKYPTVTITSERLLTKYGRIGVLLNLRTEAQYIKLNAASAAYAEIEAADLVTKLGGSTDSSKYQFVLWIDADQFQLAADNNVSALVGFETQNYDANKADTYTIRVIVKEEVADLAIKTFNLASDTATPETKDIDNTNYAFNQSHVTRTFEKETDNTKAPEYKVTATYDVELAGAKKAIAFVVDLNIDLDNVKVETYTSSDNTIDNVSAGAAYTASLVKKTAADASKYGATGKEFVVIVETDDVTAGNDKTVKLLFTNEYTGKSVTADVVVNNDTPTA